MCREMNIEYVILIGAGMVAVGISRGRIESGRLNTGWMVMIRPSCTFTTPWIFATVTNKNQCFSRTKKLFSKI